MELVSIQTHTPAFLLIIMPPIRTDRLATHMSVACRHSLCFNTISVEVLRLQSLEFDTLRQMFADPLERQASCRDLLFYDRNLEKVVSHP